MVFKLKEIRKSKNITQKQLSEETNLSVSYIQKLEIGDRKKPSYEAVIKIAKALEVEPQELFLSK